MNVIASFDIILTRRIQSLPRSWQSPMSVATFFGEPVVILAVSLFAAGISWKQNHTLVAKALIAVIVASGINGILKYFFHRPRPETLYVSHMRFKSYSFPSGHSFSSLLLYGLLAYVAYSHLNSLWGWIAIALASIGIFAIGLSRVYLGAHFPTDVLAGWVLSVFCLFGIAHYFL